MKYLFLTLVLVIVTSFTSGHYKQDSLKTRDSIMPISVVAMDKTDKKVDSIFRNPSGALTLAQFNEGLSGIMRHIDTLNMAGIILMKQRDSIDEERHKESIAKINAIEAYYKIQEKFQESERINEWRDKASHVFFAFTGSFLGMAFFAGMIKGIRKRNIYKSKHERE